MSPDVADTSSAETGPASPLWTPGSADAGPEQNVAQPSRAANAGLPPSRAPRFGGRGKPPATPVAARAGLVWTLVRTDFKARYHGTVGGFLWALLKPLCMFGVLMSVFSFVFAATPTYKLDLIVGLFLWDFFAEGTKTGLTSLPAKRFLLTRARCPLWILVVTLIANAFITLAVFAVVIAGFLVVSHQAPAPVPKAGTRGSHAHDASAAASPEHV